MGNDAHEACMKLICHHCHHIENVLQWVVHEGPRGPWKFFIKLNNKLHYITRRKTKNARRTGKDTEGTWPKQRHVWDPDACTRRSNALMRWRKLIAGSRTRLEK